MWIRLDRYGPGGHTISGEPITVIVSGSPIAKARPRATKRGIIYTPAATKKYEAHAPLAAQLAMDGRPPLDVPVRVEVLAELPKKFGVAPKLVTTVYPLDAAASNSRAK